MLDPGGSGLTVKQKRFADLAIQTGNQTQAALQVYDTKDYNTASLIGSENIRKHKVQQYIKEQCKIAGLTVPKVLLRLSEQLDANKTLISPNGKRTYEVVDYHARHKAIETSIKYVLPEFQEVKSKEGDHGSKHLHLHMPSDRLKRFIGDQ